ncbi:hypothetical protein RJT34_23102 [Clitoria ternatea]|uniref:Uncharacterized protein n=1 Tax=Clitoria ternatea TaxID=43366 RepID=A0AAN9IEM3_CLITE
MEIASFTLIQVCVDAFKFDLVELLYDELTKRSIFQHCHSKHYGKAVKFDQIEKVLLSMLESATCKSDVWTMNTIINLFGNMSQIDMIEK